jgi:hypothetical protein
MSKKLKMSFGQQFLNTVHRGTMAVADAGV